MERFLSPLHPLIDSAGRALGASLSSDCTLQANLLCSPLLSLPSDYISDTSFTVN